MTQTLTIPLKTRSESFFVLDDEYPHAEHAHFLIANAGWSVEFECDPTKGVQRIDELRPDIVLMDLRFGASTIGFSLLEDIRTSAERSKVKIPFALFLTGLRDDETRARIIGTRGSIRVEKPFNDEDLIAACSEAASSLPAWRSDCQVKLNSGLWPDEVNTRRLKLIDCKFGDGLRSEEEQELALLQKEYGRWLDESCSLDISCAERALIEIRKLPKVGKNQ